MSDQSISWVEKLRLKWQKFSPVPPDFLEPPMTGGSQQKYLTGTPRIVRDLVVSIHSSIQQWNNIHLHGLGVLQNIRQLKNDQTYPDKLEDLCDDLSKDCDKLDQVVRDLEEYAVQLNAIKLLHEGTLFGTWPVEWYVQTAEFIRDVYRGEATARRNISRNVARGCPNRWRMCPLAAWVRQINIHDDVTTAMEYMLVAIGHRSSKS